MKLHIAAVLLSSLLLSQFSIAADASSSSPTKKSDSDSANSPARPRFQARPVYPKDQIDKTVRGEVVVDFVIDTDGTVKDAKAVRQTNELFAAAAVTAVKKWIFIPAKKDGVPVKAHMQVPIIMEPPGTKKK